MARAKSWRQLAGVLLLLGLGVAVAQEGEEIWVGAERVARIYAKGPYDSVADRRVAIEKAINGVVASQDMEKAEVTLEQGDGLWTISVGGTKVMSVYPGDAAAHGKELATLAAEWYENFKTQLPKAARVAVSEIAVVTAPVAEEPATGRPESTVAVEEPVTGRHRRSRGAGHRTAREHGGCRGAGHRTTRDRGGCRGAGDWTTRDRGGCRGAGD